MAREMMVSVRTSGLDDAHREPVINGRVSVYVGGVRVEVTEDPMTKQAIVRIDPSDYAGDRPIHSDHAVETEDLSVNMLQVRWRGWAGR